jgi:hypothetical protein
VRQGLKSERCQTAIAFGCLAAVVWGIAVSLRGFLLVPLDIQWTDWATQLFAGVGVCLVSPLLWFFVTEWTRTRSPLVPVELPRPRR